MTTFRQEIAIATIPNATGPRSIPRTADNIPKGGLTHLYRFAEANLTGGLLDAVTGVRSLTSGATNAGDGTEAMLAGGGYRVTGWRYLVGPTIVIDQPWTVAVTLTRAAPPGVDGSAQTVLFVGAIDQAGFDVWLQALAGETIAAGGLHTAYVKRRVNTETQGAGGIPRVWVAQYAKPEALIARHRGGGVIDIFQRRGPTLVSLLSTTWDMAAIQGAAGSRQASLPVNLGGSANLRGGIVTYDLLATYDRALTDEELVAYTLAGEAIAATRGRS